MRANLDISDAEIVLSTGNGPLGIEYYAGADPIIFWVEGDDLVIKSASPDGTNVKTIVSELFPVPKYITVASTN